MDKKSLLYSPGMYKVAHIEQEQIGLSSHSASKLDRLFQKHTLAQD